MNLIHWDPTRDLSMLQGDVNQLFDRFFGGEGAAASAGAGNAWRRRWVPSMDILEQENDFVVRADLPGMKPEDVTIEVEDHTLRIAGERRARHEGAAGNGTHRIERSWGRFERSLTLPDGIDSDAIDASFEDGVLELNIPKPEQQQPRKVQIKAGSSAAGGASRRQVEGEAVEGREAGERELANA